VRNVPYLLFSAQVSDNLQLRPAPPPEAIPETSWPWWPFVVLAFLAAIVIAIRLRSRRIALTPEQRLQQAIDQARKSRAGISHGYLQLQKQLCLFLSERCHSRWRSLTSQQVEKEWEQLFPEAEHGLAQQIVESWKNAEFIDYGRGIIEENQLDQLTELATILLAKLSPERQDAKKT
jgi:hypothetical protein